MARRNGPRPGLGAWSTERWRPPPDGAIHLEPCGNSGGAPYVHIGAPVIGSDGVIYGFYQSPHLADTPITPAEGSADWTTSVAVPADVASLYIQAAVEAKQQKNFVGHAIDITNS